MKVITLRIPAPFDTGPQYDKNGKLISGSWPAGLPHEGIEGWHQLGQANGGLSLCEFIAEDSWPISSIPGGWRATSGHMWNGVDQSYEYEDDNGDPQFHYGLVTDLKTDTDGYLGHIPPPADGEGNPIVGPVEYHRIHKFQGWPEIID